MSAGRKIMIPEVPQDLPRQPSELLPPQLPERFLRQDLLLKQYMFWPKLLVPLVWLSMVKISAL